MALTTLPKELLLMVIDFLPPLAIESLALTLHKAITFTCLPLLVPLFERRRHIARMSTRFGDLQKLGYRPQDAVPQDAVAKYRAVLAIPTNAELIASGERDMIHGLDYLSLNEDLHWLAPLDTKTAQIMRSYQDPALPPVDPNLQPLVDRAEQCDVKLPPSFVKLFSNQHLRHRIPSSRACYFHISGYMRLAPISLDYGAGGYVVRFYCDQQGCYFWSLYIEPGPEGRHCVLGSSRDLDENQNLAYIRSKVFRSHGAYRRDRRRRRGSEEEGEDDGEADERDVDLCGWGFEEWLARTYFEEWLWLLTSDWCNKRRGRWKEGDEGLGPLKEYVRENYVQK